VQKIICIKFNIEIKSIFHTKLKKKHYPQGLVR